MKKVVGTIWFALLFSCVLFYPQQSFAGNDVDTHRHVETTGGFSFVPPEGWQVRELPGVKYKVIVGPTNGGFGTNINVVEEACDTSLEAYAEASKQTLKKMFKNCRVIQEDAFTTSTGLSGIRMIIENEMNGKRLRQTFFLFAAPKKVFVVTCTTAADGSEDFDATFAISMDTFRFEKS